MDNCTRVARVCSDRQRAGALPPPPELPLSVLVGCGGAENVFVRGGLWEEADRRLAVRCGAAAQRQAQVC